MKKFTYLLLAIFLITATIAGCGGSKEGASGETTDKVSLKIALPTWTGYGPLY